MRLTLGRTAPKPAEAPPAAGTLARLRPAIARWVPAVARSVPLSLAAFAIFAALLLLPSLLLGVNQTDSSAYNYVWAKQFAGLTRSGQVYPRWLPDSFGGLGSPAFVFYPPLAFFLDALVNIFTLDAMPVSYRLALTSTLLLWLSGAAMQAWLRGAVRPAVAFAAALAYMAAPFHMTDHYWRGAFAEFSFFAVLPFLPLAIRIAAREWRGIAGVALSFALLILAHLPTALLTAITVLPIYTLYAAARQGRLRPAILALLRCGVGVALGLGLAAIYLVPALTLQGSIASQYLWDRYHSPEPWLLLHVAQWPSPQFMAMLASFAAAVAVLSAGVLGLTRPALDPRRPDAIVWAAIGLVCILLMAGVVPHFWTAVPFVAKVQFPWRLLAVAEFAAVTAFAMAAGQMSRRRMAVLSLVALVAALPGLALLTGHSVRKIVGTQAYWEKFQRGAGAHMPDASEYLPAGFPPAFVDTVAGSGPWTLPAPGSASCEPAASLCRAATLDAAGTTLVRVDARVPTTVTVSRFYFPDWRAQAAGGGSLPLRLGPPYQFLQFAAPAGASEILLYVGRTPAEQWGLACSTVSLVTLLACAALRRRRGKPA